MNLPTYICAEDHIVAPLHGDDILVNDVIVGGADHDGGSSTTLNGG